MPNKRFYNVRREWVISTSRKPGDGRLDIAHLARTGETRYVKSKIKKIKKPKILVINDLTMMYPTYNTLAAIGMLQSFQSQGWMVYISNKQGLEPIDMLTLVPEQLKSMAARKPRKIYQLALQKGWTADDILLLDAATMQLCVAAQDNSNPSFADLPTVDVFYKNQLLNLKKIIETSENFPLHILLETSTQLDILADYLVANPECLGKIVISLGEQVTLLDDNPNLEVIYDRLVSYIFRPAETKEEDTAILTKLVEKSLLLESLRFDMSGINPYGATPTPPEFIAQLVLLAQQVKKLSFDDTSIMREAIESEIDEQQQLRFPNHVQTFDVSMGDVTGEEFSDYSQVFSHCKSYGIMMKDYGDITTLAHLPIDIQGLKITSGNMGEDGREIDIPDMFERFFEQTNFPQLRTLDLNLYDNDEDGQDEAPELGDHLQEIMRHAPGLKEISIENANLSIIPAAVWRLTLAGLRKLKLTDTMLPKEFPQLLFENANKLEDLMICRVLSPLNVNLQHSLRSVKKFDYEGDARIFFAFIDRMPNLEEVKYTFTNPDQPYEELQGDHHLELPPGAPLPSLRKIATGNMEFIHIPAMVNLFARAINLYRLEVGDALLSALYRHKEDVPPIHSIRVINYLGSMELVEHKTKLLAIFREWAPNAEVTFACKLQGASAKTAVSECLKEGRSFVPRDTAYKHKTFTPTVIFQHPAREFSDEELALRTRLNVNDVDFVTGELVPVPVQLPTEDLKMWSIRPNSLEAQAPIFQGTYSLTAKANQFYRLPSLNAQEILLSFAYRASDASVRKRLVRGDDGFIYVAFDRDGDYEVYWHVATVLDAIPDRFVEFQKSFREKFSTGPLEGLAEHASFVEWIEQVGRQMKGSCVQRCIYAYTTLTRQGCPVRIVQNEAHAFLEVYQKEFGWCPLDLGGYPGKIKLQYQRQDLAVDYSEIPIEDEDNDLAPTEAISYRNFEEKVNQLDPSMANALIVARKNQSLSAIYRSLATNPEINLFICASFDEVKFKDVTLVADTGGHAVKRPTSDLAVWLMDNTNHLRKIWFIDARQFSDDELIQLNDILLPKGERHIEGVAIPDHVQVMVAYDIEAPTSYKGNDFKRRINQTFYNFDSELTSLAVADEQQEDAVVLNLHASVNWVAMLIGRWLYKDQQLTWQPGMIQKILTISPRPKTIILENLPWHDVRFERFMEKFQATGEFIAGGHKIKMPPEISIMQRQSHLERQDTQTVARVSVGFPDRDHPFDKIIYLDNLINYVFEDVHFDADNKRLTYVPSVFEQNNGSRLKVFIAENLSAHEWQHLLMHANAQRVSLELLLAPQVKIPELLQDSVTEPSPRGESSVVYCHGDYREVADAMHICMSELTTNDFLEMFSESGQGQFDYRLTDIARALLENKTVVLSGKIPQELAPSLHYLRQGILPLTSGHRPFGGQVILMAEDKEDLQHFASESEIRVLEASPSILSLANDPMETTTVSTSEQGLFRPLKRLRAEDDLNQEAADEYDGQQEALFRRLAMQHNQVLLQGPSGQGKTTFVLGTLRERNDKYMVYEAKHYAKWLNAPNDGRMHILFIDEANHLSSNPKLAEIFGLHLSNLAAMQDTRPSVYLEGKHHDLPPHLVAAFGCNPTEFGSGRNELPLFKKISAHFNLAPLPPAKIYHSVILPKLRLVLADESLCATVAEIFVDAYRQIYKINPHSMTAREVKAMLAIFLEQDLRQDVDALLHAAYEIASLISLSTLDDPQQKIHFQENFARHLSGHTQREVFMPAPVQVPGYAAPFVFKDNFTHAYLLLSGLMQGRHKGTLGMNGMLLEGEPGVGKTHFMRAMATLYGCQVEGQDYFLISSNMSMSEKKQILKTAWRLGAVVLTDEFNVGKWPVRTLNNYLNGHDSKGREPFKRGFLFIATENDASMAGREAKDPALRHRMIQCTIPTLTPRLELQSSRGKRI